MQVKGRSISTVHLCIVQYNNWLFCDHTGSHNYTCRICFHQTGTQETSPYFTSIITDGLVSPRRSQICELTNTYCNLYRMEHFWHQPNQWEPFGSDFGRDGTREPRIWWQFQTRAVSDAFCHSRVRESSVRIIQLINCNHTYCSNMASKVTS